MQCGEASSQETPTPLPLSKYGQEKRSLKGCPCPDKSGLQCLKKVCYITGSPHTSPEPCRTYKMAHHNILVPPCDRKNKASKIDGNNACCCSEKGVAITGAGG